MVNIENKVDINTNCEANLSLALYSLESIAVLLATGIDTITIGIENSNLSYTIPLSIK